MSELQETVFVNPLNWITLTHSTLRYFTDSSFFSNSYFIIIPPTTNCHWSWLLQLNKALLKHCKLTIRKICLIRVQTVHTGRVLAPSVSAWIISNAFDILIKTNSAKQSSCFPTYAHCATFLFCYTHCTYTVFRLSNKYWRRKKFIVYMIAVTEKKEWHLLENFSAYNNQKQK